MRGTHITDMHLSDYLSKLKLSDEDFAERAGVDRSTVSRWRNRVMRPSAEQIVNINEITGGRVDPASWFEPVA
jgi:transcriptional regulator with XRE-family HTH domain